MEWVRQGFLVESACVISVLHIWLGSKISRRKEAIVPVLYGMVMKSRIRASQIMDEIKVISTTKPHSLVEATELTDKKLQLELEYNMSLSWSNLPTYALISLFILAFIIWRPLVLTSIIICDLIITRLRIHVRNSFS